MHYIQIMLFAYAFLIWIALQSGNDNILYLVKDMNKGNLPALLYAIRQMNVVGNVFKSPCSVEQCPSGISDYVYHPYSEIDNASFPRKKLL